MRAQPQFDLNQMVRLRKTPERTGVIREILSQEGGVLYRVFFSTQDQPYVKEADLSPLVESSDDPCVSVFDVGLDALRREILLAKLRSPHGESLYSLHASRLEFQVYQFKPVLKFLANPEQRLLIADEVGLGKTIEAGIILTELEARLDLERVLVVVPSGLRHKWQDELRARFMESYEILDSAKMRKFLDESRKHGAAVRLRGIVSLDMLRASELLARLGEEEVHFDFVIIDEAHNCRNPGTRSHELATVLSENADAMLLLTATPLHLGNEDLFHLMQILEPGEFDDFANFEFRILPNRLLNAAARAIAAGEPWKAREQLLQLKHSPSASQYAQSISLDDALLLLEQRPLAPEAAVKCQRLLLELNSLAHFFTRTRKREVDAKAPVREAHILTYRYTAEEASLYEAIGNLVRAEWRRGDQSAPIGFRLVTRERQAASCLPAFAERYLRQEAEYSLDPEEIDVLSSLGGDLPDAPAANSWCLPPELRETARRLLKGTAIDTKFERFRAEVAQILSQEPTAKIMVFSFFLATIKYLQRRLRDCGYDALVIDGGVPVDRRLSIIDGFRQASGAVILLSSEVGSEGLDFQFCHILFNYDLPWNPMKVEQRIGRIDRFGQQNPKVLINSMVAQDTIEDRVLARLYKRINVFEETIGDLEEILGDEMSGLSRALYTKDLTPEQQVELAESVAQSILRRKQDLEEFEEHKMEFMGQDDLFGADIEAALDTGRFVAPMELKALVGTFMSAISDKAKLERNEGEETYVFTPDEQLVEQLRMQFAKSEYSDEVSRSFRMRLRPAASIPATFTDTLAYERGLLEYIQLNHPLCRAAIQHWKGVRRGEYPLISASMETGEAAPGDYFVFLFGLRIEALRSQERLIAVAIDASSGEVASSLSERFMRVVQDAQGPSRLHGGMVARRALEETGRIALEYISRVRDEVETEQRRRNAALVDMRLASLDQTYQSKNRLFQRYLEAATDQRIQRMRQGQLSNLGSRHEVERAKVEARRDVTVTFALELVGFVKVLSIGSIPKASGREREGADERALAGSLVPGDVSLYSRTCKHGVPLGQICCICEPGRFREMTGID